MQIQDKIKKGDYSILQTLKTQKPEKIYKKTLDDGSKYELRVYSVGTVEYIGFTLGSHVFQGPRSYYTGTIVFSENIGGLFQWSIYMVVNHMFSTVGDSYVSYCSNAPGTQWVSAYAYILNTYTARDYATLLWPMGGGMMEEVGHYEVDFNGYNLTVSAGLAI